jgi:hypothetical protein
MAKTSPADLLLAQQLGQININGTAAPGASKHTFHLLTFEYPACSLLPGASTMPHLLSPCDLVLHCPPAEREYLGILEFSFFATFPVIERPRIPVPQLDHIALLFLVDNLATWPGISKLMAVSFFDPAIDDVVFRFRLQTVGRPCGPTHGVPGHQSLR